MQFHAYLESSNSKILDYMNYLKLKNIEFGEYMSNKRSNNKFQEKKIHSYVEYWLSGLGGSPLCSTAYLKEVECMIDVK